MSSQLVSVPMSPGEALDRLSIMEVKTTRIPQGPGLDVVMTQMTILRSALDRFLADTRCAAIYGSMVGVNAKLWDVEDAVRSAMRTGDEPSFARSAKLVPILNGERSNLKTRLDNVVGCGLAEVKQYETCWL